MKELKKKYIKPSIKVYEMRREQPLLTSSDELPYGGDHNGWFN